MEKIIIFGAGGHAKVATDILRLQSSFEIVAYITEAFSSWLEKDKCFFGSIPVVTEQQWFENSQFSGVFHAFVAVGDNWRRHQIAQRVSEKFSQISFVSLVHPQAVVAASAEIAPGALICGGAVVGAGSCVGSHSIVNTGALVDHDCQLKSFSSVGPGSVLGGGVTIGLGTAVGLRASVIHQCHIGDHAVIGAGATVLKPIPSLVVAYGTPCKVVRSREIGDTYL